MVFTSFDALHEHLAAQEAAKDAVKTQQAKVQAQMDAMWNQRAEKQAKDRQAQIKMAWYLHN